MKKIAFKIFMICVLGIIPSFTFAVDTGIPNNGGTIFSTEIQTYVDKVSGLQENISDKINLVSNFSYIGDSYRNTLITDLQAQENLVTSFETNVANGICISYNSSNSLIKRALAAGMSSEGGVKVCEVEDVAVLFESIIEDYKFLTKKLFIYSSCNTLSESIEDNFELLNSIRVFIDTLNLPDMETLNQSLTNSENNLNILVNQVSDLIVSVDSISLENYDEILTFRQQFLTQDYDNFIASYVLANEQVITDTEDAIARSGGISTILSTITSNVDTLNTDNAATIEVSVQDYQSRLLADYEVQLFANQDGKTAGISINPSGVIKTDSQGVASFQFTATKSGKVNFNATINSIEIFANNLLEVILSITPEEQECIAGGGSWIKDACVCKDGFEWNVKTNKCEVVITPEEQGCLDTDGKWTGKECICPDGYEWNSKDKKCEIISSGGGGVDNPTQTECEEGGGSWIKDTCVCKDGFEWNVKTNKCEVVVSGPTQVECEKGGGSWIKDACVCPDNYTWNTKTERCEK
jgi:hypothetical protein